MASNTVKCVNCNVVINELLAFLRNVMDFMDEESIHQLCTSTFSEAEVLKAKLLLFESLPTTKKMPKRRAEGKKKTSRDLEDIISLLKSTDTELTPIFVAKDLHKLPPVTFDHVDVTRLLKDILKLKTQINMLEEKIVTIDQFDQLKKQVENLRHASILDSSPGDINFVNKKRGACLQDSLYNLNSGPIGLQYMPITHLPQTAVFKPVNGREATPRQSSFTTEGEANFVSFLQRDTTVEPDLVEVEAAHAAASIGVRESETTCATLPPTAGEKLVPIPTTGDSTAAALDIMTFDNQQRTDAVACNKNIIVPGSAQLSTSSLRNNVVSDANVNCEVTEKDSEWELVRRKASKKYKLVGQKGRASVAPEGKFRAADVKIPLFISNVNKDTTECDIVKYIKDKTNENVSLKQINMRKIQKYNAFKLYVSKQNVDIFLNDQFWPDGITFRRFVHFKYRTNSDSSGVKVT